MKAWMLPWLFPVILVAAVVVIVVLGDYAAYLALPVACLGVVGVCLLWRARYGSAGDDPDADVNYWRLPHARPRP